MREESPTVVWVPSMRTLIAGDLVFNGIHVWLAASSGDTRRDWSAALDRLSDLDPASIIAVPQAGHRDAR